MAIQVIEVTNKRELKAFIRFPYKLYAKNPYWVPAPFFDELNTLRWDRNPAFEHCEAKYWLAYRDGRIAGRVAGIINHNHFKKWGQPFARFGWLDFVDDPAVSADLMAAVEDWSKKEGLTALHGPLGFTDLDREGMLIEGFNELGTLATNYNHPYYPIHLERLGYDKDIDWVEYEISVPQKPDEKIARMAENSLRRNRLHLLEVMDKRAILPYGLQIFDVLVDAYQDLYSFVPFSERQIEFYIKQYFGFVTPDFVPVVLDENERVVAFGLVLPSLSRALQKARGRLFPFGFIFLLKALYKNARADLYLVAVRREYQGAGVNAIIINQVHQVFNRMGIKKVESNPELETNSNVQSQWKFFETRQHKRRRCFIKHFV